jgi:Tfp pilus assembly protein PilO
MFNISLSKLSISDLKKYTKFIIIFVVILFLVGGYFLWWPKYQEFRQSSINLDVESEKVKKKKDYISELENNLNNLANYQEEMLKINSALPLGYSASSLFSFVQKIASESGLIITAADLSETSSSAPRQTTEPGSTQIDRMDINVTITGGYASFENFLSSVYKNSRLVEIKKIDIAPVDKNGVTVPDSYDFSLEIYANYYNKVE